jgi:hypothetical protein
MTSINSFLKNLIDFKEDYIRLSKEIDCKKAVLQSIIEKKMCLREQQTEKMEKILTAKEKTVKSAIDQDNLAQRNESVKDKFNYLNKDLKQRAENISESKNRMLKNLGMKLNIEPLIEDNWDVKVN